ncbi:MAG: phage tail assembly chaperone [Pseudomonadota bacterium]
MFKVTQSPTYLHPVTVVFPGSKAKHVFDAEFRRLSQDEIASLFDRAKRGELDDKSLAREVMAGWKGVSDDNGEMYFSASSLETLLAIFPIPSAIVEAFFDSLKRGREKN